MTVIKVITMDKKMNKSEMSFCELVNSQIKGLRDKANSQSGTGFLAVALEDLGEIGTAVTGTIGGGSKAGLALAYVLSQGEEPQVIMPAAFISWLDFVEPSYAIEVAKMVSEKAQEISAKAAAKAKK